MARDQIKMEMTGARQLRKLFKKLPTGVARRVLRKAVKAAQKPVLKAYKANVRGTKKNVKGGGVGTVSGALRKAPGIKAVLLGRGRRGGRIAMSFVGPKSKHAPHAHLIEFGTRLGVPAYAPLRRAWNANKQQVKRILKAELKAGIKREAKKLRGKNRARARR